MIDGLEPVPRQYGPKRFFHFTSLRHLDSIEQRGVIIPTESNVGSAVPGMDPFGTHVGPDVVWLLDVEDPYEYGHGLIGAGQFPPREDKRAVRIEVDVPAILWLAWAPALRSNPAWRHVFMHAGGGEGAYGHWYVWPAPIKRGRWVDISFISDHRKEAGDDKEDREVRDPRGEA